MEQDLQNIFIFTLTPEQAIANLAMALVCGILISIFYRLTYKGVSYSGSYVVSIIMLAMITAMVIMVIGNNLARAFGLVGAMSIIRFRTAVKHTEDIMYIFFALAAGLACGASMYAISLIGTLVIGVSMLVVSLVFGENPKKKEFLLQIVVNEHDEKMLSAAIGQYCKKYKLVNVKTVSEYEKNLTEFSYYVVLKKESDNAAFAAKLKETEGVVRANLFFDEA